MHTHTHNIRIYRTALQTTTELRGKRLVLRHAIAPHLLLQLSRHLLTPGEEGAWVGASLSQNTSVGRPGGKGRNWWKIIEFQILKFQLHCGFSLSVEIIYTHFRAISHCMQPFMFWVSSLSFRATSVQFSIKFRHAYFGILWFCIHQFSLQCISRYRYYIEASIQHCPVEAGTRLCWVRLVPESGHWAICICHTDNWSVAWQLTADSTIAPQSVQT